MRRDSKRKASSFLGYILFFITVAITVTIVLSIFVLVNNASDGNVTVIAIVMLLVITALSVLCTIADYIRRKIMIDKPVIEILNATDKIAKGDFSVRIKPFHSYGKYDDFDVIIANLNKMTEELGKSEVLKSDFISNISHELRTPLSIIKSYVSLLARNDISKEEKQSYVTIVEEATDRLNNLVTDVLKLTKLENQSITPNLEKFNLQDFIADIVISYEQKLEEKELIFECDIEDTFVTSRKSFLEIIINNLLSNAIKFTEVGSIKLYAHIEGKNLVIKVEDTGIGMSQETGARIFDKFYQGDTSRYQVGNGLGLALVKKVIDVMGGTISVESEIGVGSKFTVVLSNDYED